MPGFIERGPQGPLIEDQQKMLDDRHLGHGSRIIGGKILDFIVVSTDFLWLSQNKSALPVSRYDDHILLVSSKPPTKPSLKNDEPQTKLWNSDPAQDTRKLSELSQPELMDEFLSQEAILKAQQEDLL